MDRDWRDANGPQWAKDAAQSEIDAFRLTAALSWPTEARPEPLPFRWGEYDRLFGEPVEGDYWAAAHRLRQVSIAQHDGSVGRAWKRWMFAYDGADGWTTQVQRGPLFASKRDAILYNLWDECEKHAKALMIIKSRL